jgi:ankyrin repeat protein
VRRHSLVALLLVLCACEEPGVGKADIHGFTPLQQAVRDGDVAAVEALLQEGYLVNVTDANGVTPLHRAVRYNDERMSELLLVYGADPNALTVSGAGPMKLAVRAGNEALARMLIAYGARLDVADGVGRTPLHWAVDKKSRPLVDVLTSEWEVEVRDPDQPDPGVNPDTGEPNPPRMMSVKRQPKINRRDQAGDTPLHVAVASGQQEIIMLLLIRGARVDVANEDGITPRDLAAGLTDGGAVLKMLEQFAATQALTAPGSEPVPPTPG